MRKFFFLIPAMLLSLAMSATIHEIGPGDPETVVNDLLVAKLQSSAVVDGDVIELKDGIYSEYSNYLFFNKSVEVRAAEGAHPIVEVECYIKIGESAPGKNITIRGIKFDASKQDATGNQSSSYSHFIRVYSAGTLDFENCEFYGCKNQVIEVESSNSVENLIVNNCYFRDITNTCIYVQNTSESNLTITNSTFANIDATGVSAGIIDTKTATGTVVVDHCTFYDCKAKNTDYGVIGHNGSFTSDFTVSNSIFAWGTMYDKRATYLPSGTAVSNCLTYNTNKDTDKWGHHSGPTFSNCMLQDPLFNDLANNKYTYAGTYGVSMSPARGAGTDGSDLGDPRWYTKVTYPSTNFAAPGYYCTADNAVLSGGASASKFYLNTEADPHHIIWKETAYNDNVATWHLKATRACEITVALDLGPAYSSNKHIYEVKILDANNNPVGTLAEDPADPDGDTENNVEADQIKTFDGTIIIPAEGDYTVELRNIRGWGKGTIKNIILKYEGEAPITDFSTPYACTADKATLSGGASASKFYLNTEADPHHIIWKETAYNDNVATWHLTATRACHVSVALDLGPAYSSNKHIFEVKILDSNNNPVGTLAEDPADPDGVTENNVEADQVKTFDGTINIPAAGDYTVELRNIRGWGKGTIKNIILSYAGGAVVEIPNDDIDLADAILNTDATRDGDGIHFNGLTTASAKWNIQAEEGLYTFTAICTSTNWSNLKIEVLDTEENELFSYAPQYTYNQADKEISSPSWFLSAGNYIVRLSNPASSSNGYVKSFSATKATDVLVIDEMANDNSAIHAANGQSKQIVLKRTFKGGMYNTLCVPFTEWSSSDLTKIFGDGYELLVMESATLNGNELTLNFDADSQLRHGRPYLVKPTKDVENPVFAARTIDESTGYNTKEGADANFIGSFIAGEVPAGEQNLFLGPNNLLYFSQTATPIKGMRAYFHVKVPGAANVIKHARIVTGTQVITAIDLVEENTNTIKTIENGQLIIIRDGIRYNVMGNKIQ